MAGDPPPAKRLKYVLTQREMRDTLQKHFLTPYRLNFAETIKVLVGVYSQQEFTVYIDIIAKRSVFFLEYQRTSKDKTKSLELRGSSPKTFDVYLHCLYYNEVPECVGVQPPDDEHWRHPADFNYMSLVHLYGLANTLVDTVTANMVIDEFKNFGHGSTPGRDIIELAFSFTEEGDKLRSLLADLYIFDENATYRLHLTNVNFL
ncbi:hypothetical protein Q7P36_007140 [Cladosporium allicinum]